MSATAGGTGSLRQQSSPASSHSSPSSALVDGSESYHSTAANDENPAGNSTAESSSAGLMSMHELEAKLKQVQAESEPLNISLGVEIEFLLIHAQAKPDTSRAGILGIIAQKQKIGIEHVYQLLSQPVPVTCSSPDCGKEHLFQLPLQHTRRWGNEYSSWAVTYDASLGLLSDEVTALGSDSQHVQVYKMEVQSRILHAHTPRYTEPEPADPSTHRHRISYREEIRAVLRVLDNLHTRSLPTENGHFFAVANDTCGLHVHIGNQDKGFPLQTVKNLLTTCVLNERQIDQMHAVERIGGSKMPTIPQYKSIGLWDLDQNNFGFMPNRPYNKPWSCLHHIAVYDRLGQREKGTRFPNAIIGHDACFYSEPPYPETHISQDPEVEKAAYQYTAAATVALVQRAPDLVALQALQGSQGHACTINLDNLNDFQPEGTCGTEKMTIEFRQHAGTLQGKEVVAYVDSLVKMTEWAHSVGSDKLVSLCNGPFKDHNYSTLDLLQEFGCASKTLRFYQQKLEGKPYWANQAAHARRTKINKDIEPTPDGQIVSPLLCKVAMSTRDANMPRAVRDRINRKFLCGGYGQFTADYLSTLDSPSLTPEEKTALTVGHLCPPLPNFLAKLPPLSKVASAPDSMHTRSLRPGFLSEPDLSRHATAVDELPPLSDFASPTSADAVCYRFPSGDIAMDLRPREHDPAATGSLAHVEEDPRQALGTADENLRSRPPVLPPPMAAQAWAELDQTMPPSMRDADPEESRGEPEPGQDVVVSRSVQVPAQEDANMRLKSSFRLQSPPGSRRQKGIREDDEAEEGK